MNDKRMKHLRNITFIGLVAVAFLFAYVGDYDKATFFMVLASYDGIMNYLKYKG